MNTDHYNTYFKKYLKVFLSHLNQDYLFKFNFFRIQSALLGMLFLFIFYFRF